MTLKITHIVAIVACVFFSASCSKKEKEIKPEQALSELLSNPPDNRDSSLASEYVLVGRPTNKIRTAPSAVPSHFATVTCEMQCGKTRYRCTFTVFCKDGVWYFDPDGPMLLEQPNDSWSSAEPRYALHECKMAATFCLDFKS